MNPRINARTLQFLVEQRANDIPFLTANRRAKRHATRMASAPLTIVGEVLSSPIARTPHVPKLNNLMQKL